MKAEKAKRLRRAKENFINKLQANIELYQEDIRQIQCQCDHDCEQLKHKRSVGWSTNYWLVTICPACGKEIDKVYTYGEIPY